jgi:hypothetical protein
MSRGGTRTTASRPRSGRDWVVRGRGRIARAQGPDVCLREVSGDGIDPRLRALADRRDGWLGLRSRDRTSDVGHHARVAPGGVQVSLVFSDATLSFGPARDRAEHGFEECGVGVCHRGTSMRTLWCGTFSMRSILGKTLDKSHAPLESGASGRLLLQPGNGWEPSGRKRARASRRMCGRGRPTLQYSTPAEGLQPGEAA